MKLKLSEYVDNGAYDCPFWTLILGSAIMILLAIGHIIRLIQSSKKLHILFVLSLICSTVQYICATQNIDITFLTLIADFFAISSNTALFYFWIKSMMLSVGSCSLFLVHFVLLPFIPVLLTFIVVTLIGMYYPTSYKDNHEFNDFGLTFWEVTLITSIVGNIILTLFTLSLQCRLEPYGLSGGQRKQKRLQLACLSLLSLLLLVSKFGILFGIPLLYTVPFLLFHTIPILKRDSVPSYYRKPYDVNV
jgi:hypothetical protein